MKETTREGILGMLSSLGIFYLFEMLYAILRNTVDMYYGFFQVLEIMKLSPLFTSIPSLAVGIIIWNKIKSSKEFSKEFSRWFIITILLIFSFQIVRYLIWYYFYALPTFFE